MSHAAGLSDRRCRELWIVARQSHPGSQSRKTGSAGHFERAYSHAVSQELF